MALFPDFAALAKARENRVLKAWEGLGYYNRASNLQKLAGVVVRDFGGELPRNFEALLGLPGIGPYSARSIGSIAFGMPLACVDGNVVRVLARVEGVKKSYASSSEAAKSFQKIADEVLDKSHPGEHNEAMMELGATICTKANPKCEVCPLKPSARPAPQATPKAFQSSKRPRPKPSLSRVGGFAAATGFCLWPRRQKRAS
jgi:A/G-specific adenine glycosylase